jgi:hypothetical protein
MYHVSIKANSSVFFFYNDPFMIITTIISKVCLIHVSITVLFSNINKIIENISTSLRF